MFPNLRAEIARNGLTHGFLSRQIGITEKSFSNKMNGHTEFTRSEMVLIRKSVCPHESFEYLFATDQIRVTS